MMFKAKLHLPLIFSLLCPGIGQMAQRRWLAGLLYFLIFIALSIALVVCVVVMMATNVDAAMAFVNNEPNKDFATGEKLPIIWITVVLHVVYIAGLIDTYRGLKRQLEEKMRTQLKAVEQIPPVPTD